MHRRGALREIRVTGTEEGAEPRGTEVAKKGHQAAGLSQADPSHGKAHRRLHAKCNTQRQQLPLKPGEDAETASTVTSPPHIQKIKNAHKQQ